MDGPIEDFCREWNALLAVSRAGGTVLVAVTTVVAASLAWLVKSFIAWLSWAYIRFLEQIELLRAIRAEIEANLASESYYATRHGKERLLQLMRDNPVDAPDFIPYVAVFDSDPIHGAFKELRLLPAQLIDKIVTYYNYSLGLGAQLNDLRSDAFRSIGRTRQAAVIAELFDIAGRLTVSSGRGAVRAISLALLLRQVQDVVMRISFAAVIILASLEIPPRVEAGLRSVRQAAKSASSCPVPLPSSTP